MESLSRAERLRLMKFVCSFAWTDLKVTAGERAFVQNLAEHCELDADERRQVDGWLKVPPPPEEVDPLDIPPAHRQSFYSAAKAMVEADGRVVPGEAEVLEVFQELLHE